MLMMMCFKMRTMVYFVSLWAKEITKTNQNCGHISIKALESLGPHVRKLCHETWKMLQIDSFNTHLNPFISCLPVPWHWKQILNFQFSLQLKVIMNIVLNNNTKREVPPESFIFHIKKTNSSQEVAFALPPARSSCFEYKSDIQKCRASCNHGHREKNPYAKNVKQEAGRFLVPNGIVEVKDESRLFVGVSNI